MPKQITNNTIKFIGIALLLVGPVAGCSRDLPRPSAPKPRIISHSTAITQILYDMGLDEHIVGVTSYCILPEEDSKEVFVIGDMSSVNSSLILAARPDLILTQTTKLGMFQAATDINPDIHVENIRIDQFGDIKAAILRIGELTGQPDLASQAIARMNKIIDGVLASVAGKTRPRVVFAMGFEHPAVMAKGSFVHDMIEIAGGLNAGEEVSGIGPWRSTSLKAIMAARPDVLIVFCSSAAEASQAKDFWAKRKGLPAVDNGRVFIVSDNRWMRPGTELAQMLPPLAEMIHPGAAEGLQK